MISLTPEEAEHMRNGEKISAIKCVRSRTSMDLIMAKAFVEQWDGKTLLKESDLGKACRRCNGTGIDPGGE